LFWSEPRSLLRSISFEKSFYSRILGKQLKYLFFLRYVQDKIGFEHKNDNCIFLLEVHVLNYNNVVCS
jgi:hypothetical protein